MTKRGLIRHSTKDMESGFSLVEMAIVLLVLGVLMRAVIQPMGARLEASQRSEAKAQLRQVKAAITGYLILNGRLPCPGMDAMREDASCSMIDGGVRAVLLGLPGEIDEAGFLLDPWGAPLRYRIASTQPWTSDWSTGGNSASNSVAAPPGADDALLVICRSAGKGGCVQREVRANQLEFVLLSYGPDASPRGSQAGNLDGDNVFVQVPESTADGREFDDQLVWMARSEVAYWLLLSGRVVF